MVRREIEIDDHTSRLLTELAEEYDGDLSAREVGHKSTLLAMRDRSQADFREGRTATWEDIKARNGF
jgi:hypothetical protein